MKITFPKIAQSDLDYAFSCLADYINCAAYEQKAETISNLMVFDGVYLDVTIQEGTVSYKISDGTIRVKA